MKNKYILGVSIMVFSLFSCGNDAGKADGYGNFEATEITISAENNGKLIQFNVDEGNQLKKDQFIGFIDTVQLALKYEQILISKAVVRLKSKGVLSQISVLKSKMKTAEISKARTENLIKENAATQKQLDVISGEIDVLKSQVRSIEIQNAPVVNELKSIDVQLEQITDQIKKSKIINPVNGTVLTKYAEPNEITAFGKPLYKIANLSKMQLRVYISETQLSNLKIGQEVTIKIDAVDVMKSYKGVVSWVASEAEFTPKIIQTKEERVALVYAVKVNVVNDGSLKIGMPAEMWTDN
ncbi:MULTISPECIES: HlyD family secretion protein [unclassified Polaribacter]|uniref:HlyD family secretion protein n=1 Tax=unclassified Polaribacter TaxID=196858 RepID=UPI0011BF9C87|nr:MULTISPECIES: HlyD family efflux transporter periplasmic adaptor subunit [unclassified Polaribacter]TXD50833.1 HlyD family efflux transporter periplasmic adaptor subunit [Polaribacter sp. IC063]TXD57608.1 HlyD family efflux transporter periplasmic adaptor subunit [Polaribacter sp. IC066]